MKTYLMEDDSSASLLSLDERDGRLEGTILEATWSAGMPFEATGYVGGYVRDGRLSILVVSNPGSPDFAFASEGSIDDQKVVLTRGGTDGTQGSVVFRRGSREDYRMALARIAARAVSKQG